MSSSFTHATLLGLFTAPLVALGVLAVTNRPVPPAPAPTPVVVWFAICPTGGFWGPFPDIDGCRTKLELVKATCLAPLAAPHTPNPAFVAIAAVCRDAFAGTRCACEYDVALPGRPVLPGVYTPQTG